MLGNGACRASVREVCLLTSPIGLTEPRTQLGVIAINACHGESVLLNPGILTI